MVPVRTRTPIRNACSWPMSRARSSASWKSPAPFNSAATMAERSRGARNAAEEAGRQDGVEHTAALAQDAGEPGRGAHDGRDQLDQPLVLLEQGEELDAGRQLGQKPIESEEGQVGVGGLGQRLDQERLDFGQQLAGARRAHGGVAAVMPSAHAGDDRLGALVAHGAPAPAAYPDRRLRRQRPCWRRLVVSSGLCSKRRT